MTCAQGRFSSPPVHIQETHLQVETLAFVRPHAPPDRGPLAKTYDVRLGSPESSARKQHESERRKEEWTLHPASLCICKLLEQGQATHQQQYCSKSGTVWK